MSDGAPRERDDRSRGSWAPWLAAGVVGAYTLAFMLIVLDELVLRTGWGGQHLSPRVIVALRILYAPLFWMVRLLSR